jgi:hypothetical protein
MINNFNWKTVEILTVYDLVKDRGYGKIARPTLVTGFDVGFLAENFNPSNVDSYSSTKAFTTCLPARPACWWYPVELTLCHLVCIHLGFIDTQTVEQTHRQGSTMGKIYVGQGLQSLWRSWRRE